MEDPQCSPVDAVCEPADGPRLGAAEHRSTSGACANGHPSPSHAAAAPRSSVSADESPCSPGSSDGRAPSNGHAHAPATPGKESHAAPACCAWSVPDSTAPAAAGAPSEAVHKTKLAQLLLSRSKVWPLAVANCVNGAGNGYPCCQAPAHRMCGTYAAEVPLSGQRKHMWVLLWLYCKRMCF